MRTVLVTGAAGFIGSHVAERLLSRGDRVVGIDEVNDYYPVHYKLNNLEILKAHQGFTFYQVDLRDRPSLERTLAAHEFTEVAHLAARAGVRPSLVDPVLYEESNVKGTLHLLEYFRKQALKNFVLTSSSSVYGNALTAPFREDDNATDLPISPYAATKKATEVMGYTYHHLYKMSVNVVRPFTVYGSRGRPDMAPWIFLESALTGRAIKRYGDGTSRRDYTYIDDFVSGFVAAIDRPLGYEIFNLGNSATVTLNEAIATIERVTGKPLNIEQQPLQPGDVLLTNADISKAQRMLGYEPKVSFETGMTHFCKWFREKILRD